MRFEPSEWEHLECWLRNAHAVGESRARRHTGTCWGSVHAILDSIQLGQEQTFALALPHLCEIPSGKPLWEQSVAMVRSWLVTRTLLDDPNQQKAARTLRCPWAQPVRSAPMLGTPLGYSSFPRLCSVYSR